MIGHCTLDIQLKGRHATVVYVLLSYKNLSRGSAKVHEMVLVQAGSTCVKETD